MAKFCSKCGKELGSVGRCSCSSSFSASETVSNVKSLLSKLWFRMGIGESSDKNTGMFERNQKIVPDIISTNEDEVPIKQYDTAILRSRILGKYAEGRLQITNKRLIFRAAGPSYSGKQSLQYEFSLDELGGIEAKKSHRLSLLNTILGFIVSLFIIDPLDVMFTSLNDKSSVLAYVLGTILAIACLIPFFALKRKFWLKLIFTSAAMGITAGFTTVSGTAYDFIMGEQLLDIIDISLPVILIWIFNLILVSLVPDLRLCIKTKGAGDAFQIRRKIWGFFKQPQEYTDFSEVLPWEDTDRAIVEIGAILNDLNTTGDLAIEKWRD